VKKSIVGFLIFLAASAAGQKTISDSVYTLGGVEVATDRFSNTLCGVKVDRIDSVRMRAFSTGDLHQLLRQNTSVYVKSNGVTGLSSVSVRGTGTSHTAVLWNGFNLQNPMNGGMDFSLVPVNFMNKIAVQYNGMAALYGGGALGGAIHLTNEPEYNKGLDVALGSTYGSFGNYSFNVKLGISRKNGALMVRAFYSKGKNNFPFKNNAKLGSPDVRQTNSEVESYGVIHEKAFKINEKNQLTFRLWIQESKRQIPPLMTQDYSTARQRDEFFRPALEWENNGRNYKLFVRTALLIDEYDYKDPEKLVNSSSGTTASVTQSEVYFKIFPYHTMNVGAHYKYTAGHCDYYTQKHFQHEVSAFISYNAVSKHDKWKMNVALREEYSNSRFVPVLPSFAMDIRLYKQLLLYVNVSRNYRIPTLNDLYWYPGGNTELKPEDGWAAEVGIKHHFVKGKTAFDYTVSWFNNSTRNWIIWLPEASYWSPQNIQAVWSRGAELNFLTDTEIKKVRIGFAGKTAYVRSTVQKSNNQSAIGRQLIYTPEWVATAGLDIFYKTFGFNVNAEYTSTCYTSHDNTAFLEPYVLGNIYLSKDISYKNFAFNIFLQINNIWNQKYFSVAWQAMPGINFKTGITVNFKHPLITKKTKQ